MSRRFAAGLLLLALGCATRISTQIAEVEPPPTIRKLVVLPFASDPAPGGSVESDAAALVAARVLEAMTQATSFEVVPPEEAARVGTAESPATGKALREQFGIDAVLTGVVRRYIERIGGPSGSSRPASVWFSLELRSPDDVLLWSGTYLENQKPLSEDLGSFRRAWQRGFRFVTAADLASYGARELVRAMAAEI